MIVLNTLSKNVTSNDQPPALTCRTVSSSLQRRNRHRKGNAKIDFKFLVICTILELNTQCKTLIQIFISLLNPDALSLNPVPSLNIGMDAALKGSLGLQD